MNVLDSIMDLELDFSDYDKMDEIRDELNANLENLFNNEYFTIKILENILISTQQIIMHNIDWLLQKETFRKVFDLKKAFPQIKLCFEDDFERPFDNINKYISMCDYVGIIVGESDEEICSEEEYNRIQNLWQNERKSFNHNEMIVADLGFNLFSAFYDFLNYFAFSGEDITKERIEKLCICHIDNILFEILWYMDDEEENSVEESKFISALRKISAMLQINNEQ